MKIPSPNRTYFGMGYLEMAFRDVLFENSKVGKDISRQKNLMDGDLIARFDKNMPQELMDEAIDAMETKLRGVSNTGSIVGYRADGTMDLAPVPHSPYEPGLPEIYAKRIARAFRYPYAKFDGVNSNNTSSITAYNAWIDDLEDLASVIEGALTAGVLGEFEELESGARLYFANIRKEDDRYKDAKVRNMWRDGVIDRYRYKVLVGEEAAEEDKGVYYKPEAGDEDKHDDHTETDSQNGAGSD